MTAWDRVFLALVVIDVISVVALAYGAMLLLDTGKRVQRQATPAVNEAKALAAMGQAMVNHARADAHVVSKRVGLVAVRVKHRVEHTRRLVQELKPESEKAIASLQTSGKEAAHHARTLSDVARRVARLKTATEAAVQAAQTTPAA